jgi:hypothetical protein
MVSTLRIIQINRKRGVAAMPGLAVGQYMPAPAAVSVPSGLSMLYMPGRSLKPILPDYSSEGFLSPALVRGLLGEAARISDFMKAVYLPGQILDSGGKSPIINQV